MESASKQKKRHNALDTLKKIEKILRENLYSSTFPADHPLYRMEAADSIRFLQDKATEIHTGYVKKQSKLCWLWRKIFSKKKRLDAVYKRIADFTPLTKQALPIENDCIPHVLQFLPIASLGNFGQLNRHAKAHADLALNNLARKLGYKGKKIGRGKAYLKNLHHNLHFLSQQKWGCGVDNKTLFSNLIVRNHQGKILMEESLDLLKQLPIDDLARLFVTKVPSLRHLKKAILNPQISTGETFTELAEANLALGLAVRNKEFEVVQFLLAHGANANLRFGNIRRLVAIPPNETLLSLSIKQKTPVITHLLLQAKANIDLGILHVAARIPNNQKNIQLLLRYGADVNGLDNNDESAIFSAIESKSLANIRVLVKNGSNLKQTNGLDQTALYFAVKQDTPEIIKMLVKHGADPLKKVKWRKPTLFFSAIVKKNLAQVLAFIEGGAAEIIESLIRHGADPYKLDPLGNPPLFNAIKYHHLAKGVYAMKKIIPTFIEAGIDLNYTDKDGQTALHIAAKYGKPEIVKLLIKHGANPNLKDNNGLTPRDVAMIELDRQDRFCSC
ncbi:MAG: ankyrin repeat domain-containing protein [Parachlamydiaceae bacterium]